MGIDRETLGEYYSMSRPPCPPSPPKKDIGVRLSKVIKAYNTFLLYHDYPIQGYVDLFGEQIPYASFEERCQIEQTRSMITVRCNAIINSFETELYRDYSYDIFVNDIHTIIVDELTSLDNKLIYKFLDFEHNNYLTNTFNLLKYKREIMRQLGVYNFVE